MYGERTPPSKTLKHSEIKDPKHSAFSYVTCSSNRDQLRTWTPSTKFTTTNSLRVTQWKIIPQGCATHVPSPSVLLRPHAVWLQWRAAMGQNFRNLWTVSSLNVRLDWQSDFVQWGVDPERTACLMSSDSKINNNYRYYCYCDSFYFKK